jgi:probable O-glycosylation ligase (exosortase A-associated)
MKHLIFMMAVTALGAIGATIHPIYGVLLYYGFELIQPQHLWKWSLPGGIRWSLIAAAAAIFGLLIALPRVLAQGRWNLIASMTTILAAMMLLSCLNAADPEVASSWGLMTGKIVLMMLVATVTIHEVRHVRMVVWLIAGCMGYLAWHVNSLYLFDRRLDILNYGHGGLDNNGAGLLMAMAIPFVYALTATTRRWTVKAAGYFVIVLMLHAVMLTYSRMSMLCVIVGGLWLLLHHRPRWHAAGLALAGCVIVAALAGQEVRDRFYSIGNYQTDGSAQSRFDSWAAAWRIAWDHPLTGVGIRNANLFSQNYGADMYGRTIHNQYLQIAADNGLPAMTLYILLCAVALVRLNRLRHQYPVIPDNRLLQGDKANDPSIGVIALAVQTSLIMFCFGAMFLSLEVFELSWLLLGLAGVMPDVVASTESRLAQSPSSAEPRPALTPFAPYPLLSSR